MTIIDNDICFPVTPCIDDKKFSRMCQESHTFLAR